MNELLGVRFENYILDIVVNCSMKARPRSDSSADFEKQTADLLFTIKPSEKRSITPMAASRFPLDQAASKFALIVPKGGGRPTGTISTD